MHSKADHFTISIGTTNAEKIKGVIKAIRDFYRIDYIKINTMMIEHEYKQPIGLDIVIDLSIYRAKEVCSKYRNSDLCIGVEAGLIEVSKDLFNVNCVVILNKDGKSSIGFSPIFKVPDQLLKYINKGLELEKAVELEYGIKNIGSRGGLISILSRKIIDREILIYMATLMALSTL